MNKKVQNEIQSMFLVPRYMYNLLLKIVEDDYKKAELKQLNFGMDNDNYIENAIQFKGEQSRQRKTEQNELNLANKKPEIGIDKMFSETSQGTDIEQSSELSATEKGNLKQAPFLSDFANSLVANKKPYKTTSQLGFAKSAPIDISPPAKQLGFAKSVPIDISPSTKQLGFAKSVPIDIFPSKAKHYEQDEMKLSDTKSPKKLSYGGTMINEIGPIKARNLKRAYKTPSNLVKEKKRGTIDKVKSASINITSKDAGNSSGSVVRDVYRPRKKLGVRETMADNVSSFEARNLKRSYATPQDVVPNKKPYKRLEKTRTDSININPNDAKAYPAEPSTNLADNKTKKPSTAVRAYKSVVKKYKKIAQNPPSKYKKNFLTSYPRLRV